MKLETYFAR